MPEPGQGNLPEGSSWLLCWAEEPGSYPAPKQGNTPRVGCYSPYAKEKPERGGSFGWVGNLRHRFSSWKSVATDFPFVEWMGQAAGWDFCHLDSEVEVSPLVVAVVEACAGCCGSWGFSRWSCGSRWESCHGRTDTDKAALPELLSCFFSAGPTDLSMKGGASSTAPSNSTSRGMQAAQLSPTEISAVRQLIAGYRESAAFLLRSADELENLILQQN